MLIAGEPSGDMLAAELVRALKNSPELQALPFPAKFFGAGGSEMAAAGVELAFNLTRHSVIGLWEAIKKIATFRRLRDELVELACRRQPDVIVCVDFSEFNRSFAHALQKRVRAQQHRFDPWRPKVVKYISPQVWASRPGRAQDLARDHDLVLSIFPFEKQWYAERVPWARVEFIGHPMFDRFAGAARIPHPQSLDPSRKANLLLLPGSRVSELRRHLPVMMPAALAIAAARPVAIRMVLPDEGLAAMVRPWRALVPALEVQIGNLAQALSQTDVAIASTGTVTMECAYFRVPTVTLYRTSWPTYLIGRQVVTVRFLSMPNLLADAVVFPEFVQGDATPENLSRAALDLLNHPARSDAVRAMLDQILHTLGGPGASRRAARAILALTA
jgi:lipid-A-disaccharide synthase